MSPTDETPRRIAVQDGPSATGNVLVDTPLTRDDVRRLDRAVSRVLEARVRRKNAADPAAAQALVAQAERDLRLVCEQMGVLSLAKALKEDADEDERL